MTGIKFKNEIGVVLSDRLKQLYYKISDNRLSDIHEIRLRTGKEIDISIRNQEFFISPEGEITCERTKAVKAEKSDIDYAFNVACQYSVHSFQNEISQGYVTIAGGHRIGFCGSAVIKNNRLETIKDIFALNIRIAREIKGCAEDIINNLFCEKLVSVLFIGPPASGKTTVLRDICRLIGNKNKLSIIDERNEIAATVNSIPQNDVGIFSDIFNSYPKFEGIMTAIRVMSPLIIACDEIGGEHDVIAIESAMNSGVKIIATAHAGSVDEALNKKGIAKLIELNAFDYIALLGTNENIGKIISLKKLVK